jgi:HlyD family secretion protein
MVDKPAPAWSERTYIRRRRRLSGGVIAVLAIVLIVLLFFVSRKPESETIPLRTLTVERSTFREVLQQNGKVEASKVRSVFSQVKGTITWMIQEGTVVKENEEIVRMDDSDYRRTIDEFMDQTYKPAKFALESDTQTLENKRVELDISVKLAEIALKQAEFSRKQLDEKYAEDLEIARLDAEMARVQAGIAQRAVDVNKPLVEKGFVAENTLSSLTVDALNAEAAHIEALERVRRLEQGPTPLEVRAGDTAVAVARQNLETAQFDCDADLAIYESEVAEAKAGLDRVEIEKHRNEQAIERCSVKAPVPGVVVFVNVWKGSDDLSPIQLGETRTRGADLLKMADTSSLEIQMLLNEPDALKVHSDQKATVRFVAFPDLELPAHVTFVSPDAFDKNQKLGSLALLKLGEAGVRVIEVHLTLDKEDPSIRLGLTAVAEIEISRLEGVLVLPMSALAIDSRGTHCWLAKGNTFERADVELSQWNETMAVVSSGLKEGDEVLDAPVLHGYY